MDPLMPVNQYHLNPDLELVQVKMGESLILGEKHGQESPPQHPNTNILETPPPLNQNNMVSGIVFISILTRLTSAPLSSVPIQDGDIFSPT